MMSNCVKHKPDTLEKITKISKENLCGFFMVFIWFSNNIPVWKKYLFSKFGLFLFLAWNYFSKDGKPISFKTRLPITILGIA